MAMWSATQEEKQLLMGLGKWVQDFNLRSRIGASGNLGAGPGGALPQGLG